LKKLPLERKKRLSIPTKRGKSNYKSSLMNGG
jgi:hypothetical protein